AGGEAGLAGSAGGVRVRLRDAEVDDAIRGARVARPIEVRGGALQPVVGRRLDAVQDGRRRVDVRGDVVAGHHRPGLPGGERAGEGEGAPRGGGPRARGAAGRVRPAAGADGGVGVVAEPRGNLVDDDDAARVGDA